MYTLKLEIFAGGDTKKQSKWLGYNKNQPFCARIIGLDNGDFKKVYLKGYTDYAKSNSTGSRGIFRYYFLDNGLYEVNERTSWKRADHYCLKIQEDVVERLTILEALQCLIKKQD